MIGVTGATGEVGGRVARRLADRGIEQRLIVRDPSRAPDLPGRQVARATYDDAEAMREAFADVDTLFLVSASEHPERIAQHVRAVDAAAASGVERIVYLSFLGAAANATFTLARHHFATEQRVRSRGLPFTFLRSSIYLDLMPFFAGSESVIRGPAGEGRFAPVARDDIADVATAVLAEPAPHAGQTYDMTGPEAVTMREVAQHLSSAAGREIRYVNESVEEAWASRSSFGAPDWEVEGWITSYTAIARGEMDVLSTAVADVAGHPPISVPDWFRMHPEAFEHPHLS